MLDWQGLFSPNILEKARILVRNKAVKDIRERNDFHFADVSDDGTKYFVSFFIRNDKLVFPNCACKEAKANNGKCRHVAALLFSLKKSEIYTENDINKYVTLEFQDDGNPHYLSFKDSLNIYKPFKSTYDKALSIIEDEDIKEEYTIQILGHKKYLTYSVYIEDEYNSHNVSIDLGSNGITSFSCKIKDYWDYDYGYPEELCNKRIPNDLGIIDLCEHKTVALILLIRFLEKNRDIIDFSDEKALDLIKNFKKERQLLNKLVKKSDEELVDIEPLIEEIPGYYGNECLLSLKLVTENGKRYKIRSIEKFNDCVRNEVTYTVGNKDIDFSTAKLTERAQKVIELINEAELSLLYLQQRMGYQNYEKLKDTISIEDNIDNFYEIMNKTTVLYNGVPLLGFREAEPSFSLKIDEKKNEGKLIAITVSGIILGRFKTRNYIYWFKDGYLNRAEKRKLGSAISLIDISDIDGHFSFDVGLGLIDNFYQRVLPDFRRYGHVEDSAYESIENRLQEPPVAVFYLDLENKRITCIAKLKISEEEKQITPLNYYYNRNAYNSKYKDFEDEINESLSLIFLGLFDDNGKWFVRDNDESVYSFVHSGLNNLMELGVVNVSEAFKRIVVKKMPPVSSFVDIDEKDDSILNFNLDTYGLSLEELVEILNSYKNKKKFYRLKNGDFISLEEENLDSLKDLFLSSGISIKDFVNGKMHIPLYRALYLDQILNGQNGINYSAGQKYRRLIKEFKTINESDFEVPKSLGNTLRQYQKDGFRWLRVLYEHGFGGILADDMGLGKTIQTLSFLLSLKEEQKELSTLIVTPSSLVFNWKSEIQKFTPELRAQTVVGTAKERERIINNHSNYDILITSYDLLKRDISLYEGVKFDIEIIDEAQFIKNHNTSQAKTVRAINSTHRFALTGTPIENRLSELWSIFEYLMPGFLFNQESFKRLISNPIEKNGDKEAFSTLKRLTGPFILRRVKTDVLKELPDKIEEIRVTPLSGEQLKLYTAEVAKAKGMLKGQENYNEKKIEILAELMRIRELCCDPSLVYKDYKGESSKRVATIDLIKTAIDGGHKILLFSQFTSMLALLENDLNAEGISYYKIIGDTNKTKRIELVDAFNSDNTPVFLISLKAGGTGLNLTSADIVIHYDPWWNVAVQNQATDRAHRIGQTKQVTVYKMIAENTIEERILELQETKKALASEIISTDNISLSSLSKDDLLSLLNMSLQAK